VPWQIPIAPDDAVGTHCGNCTNNHVDKCCAAMRRYMTPGLCFSG
jgi:hypothetical protein